jgi:hypothetical protein
MTAEFKILLFIMDNEQLPKWAVMCGTGRRMAPYKNVITTELICLSKEADLECNQGGRML